MKANKKNVETMLTCLKDLGVLERKGDMFHVQKDFDFVVRGLIIKRLRRLEGAKDMGKKVEEAKIEGLIEALRVYGFFSVCEKPSEAELAVHCLLTFKNDQM